MKRTNLVLDEKLLEEVTRYSGLKTYSAAVQKALEDWVRWCRSRQILDLQGTGVWSGDLGEMRQDASPARPRRSRKAS